MKPNSPTNETKIFANKKFVHIESPDGQRFTMTLDLAKNLGGQLGEIAEFVEPTKIESALENAKTGVETIDTPLKPSSHQENPTILLQTVYLN